MVFKWGAGFMERVLTDFLKNETILALAEQGRVWAECGSFSDGKEGSTRSSNGYFNIDDG